MGCLIALGLLEVASQEVAECSGKRLGRRIFNRNCTFWDVSMNICDWVEVKLKLSET